MKLILAQPSIPRFKWELEVLLTNLKQFSAFDETILLFSKHDDTIPTYLANKYGCSVFVYEDNRFDKAYIPAIRPYLWWQHLKAHPEYETGQYFYIDSDIIFREMVDCATLGANSNTWVGSDCESYIGYDYIVKCKYGEAIVKRMAEITGITVDDIKATPGIGAQLVITDPTADFWERSYDDSNRIYDYFQSVDTNLQKWTAEMWAQLYSMVRTNKKVVMAHELDFCRPTDPIAKWDKVKIMHNAGVTTAQSYNHFFKGNYANKAPFGENFDYVAKDKVSLKYVHAIQSVIH